MGLELLNRQALLGDFNEIRTSFETKYPDWWLWQRNWLLFAGGLLAIGVLVPIVYLMYSFAAATLLITEQHAEYGLEELPGRLNYCIDDLNLYKRNTDARIRKLLIDDYQMLNRTIAAQLSNAGHMMIQTVKKLTGAQSVDALINISENAGEIHQSLLEANKQFKQVIVEYSQFEVDYSRMRQTLTEELRQCINDEIDSVKALCHKAEKVLEEIVPIRLKITSNNFAEDVDMALEVVTAANIPQLLSDTVNRFTAMQDRLQLEVDKKIHSSQTVLKQIADNLFVIAERASTQIRQVNFDNLYDIVAYASDPKDNSTIKYMHYSGIWMTMCVFTILCAVTAVLFFVVGNTSDIVCGTLRDPLSRPDIIELGERYLDIVRSQKRPSDDLLSLLGNVSVADLIRACQRNETLYDVFELDKMYHLKKLKVFEREEYEQLERLLEVTFADLPDFESFNNTISSLSFDRLQQLSTVEIPDISRAVISDIETAITSLDVSAKAKAFESSIGEGWVRPKVVSSMLEQVEKIDVQFARPLRSKLGFIAKNLTRINERLEAMKVPINSLLGKLQHSQALLSEDFRDSLEKAARQQLHEIIANVDTYVDHVKHEIQHEVSSCTPVMEILSSSTAAVCDQTVDPMNGAWMSMLVSLLCLVPILMVSTALVNLYDKMHSYPKYVVETPQEHHQMSSFITDIYETRQKPGFSHYTYGNNYPRNFR
ncbi:Prominin [Ancylostoma ceylanicum]|uniref:Prominin n=1 Tax=Ancylostoma ceylanicum TaxID=53326 RepID=A0A0D6M9S1_9BILA|nr:Prominin [Ancylostoma ceylanicum]